MNTSKQGLSHLLSGWSVVLAIMLLVSSQASANQQQTDDYLAELVWIEKDAKHHTIYRAEYKDEEWTEEDAVYKSENELVTPAIVSDKAEIKYLVWSEWQKGKGVLMTTTKGPNQEKWSEATRLYSIGSDNLAPNLVRDLNGTLWLFWCNESNGGTDILYQTKALGSNWSLPQLVHKRNSVPDIRPFAKINEEGSVEVSWTTFDLERNDYANKTQVFTPKISSQQKKVQDKVILAEIPGHFSMSTSSINYLYSAKNYYSQNLQISPLMVR